MKLDGIMIWVADVAATAAFYERAFGLEVAFTDDSGQYVQMVSGQTTLSFAHEGAATANGATIRPNRLADTASGVQLAMVCNDVTADFQRAIDAGATLVAALTEKPWGQTLGYLRDLNGFLVELSSPAAW